MIQTEKPRDPGMLADALGLDVGEEFGAVGRGAAGGALRDEARG